MLHILCLLYIISTQDTPDDLLHILCLLYIISTRDTPDDLLHILCLLYIISTQDTPDDMLYILCLFYIVSVQTKPNGLCIYISFYIIAAQPIPTGLNNNCSDPTPGNGTITSTGLPPLSDGTYANNNYVSIRCNTGYLQTVLIPISYCRNGLWTQPIKCVLSSAGE